MGKGHHVLFYKNDWRARPDSRKLRETHGLIIPLDRDVHGEIHKVVPIVPTLGMHALALVRDEFKPIPGSYLGTVESLMFAIETVREDPRVSELGSQLAELTINALDMQMPYLREGLIHED